MVTKMVTTTHKVQLTLAATTASRYQQLADLHGISLVEMLRIALYEWQFTHHNDHLQKFS